jgi:hypothetical protein
LLLANGQALHLRLGLVIDVQMGEQGHGVRQPTGRSLLYPHHPPDGKLARNMTESVRPPAGSYTQFTNSKTGGSGPVSVEARIILNTA